MRIFITGGTGFVGKSIVKRLMVGNSLLLLIRNKNNKFLQDIKNNKKIEVIIGSLKDIKKHKNAIKKFRPDTAIHLAWENIPDFSPEQSLKNLIYGVNLLNVLIESKCRHVLVAGSCWEYGKNRFGKLTEKFTAEPYNSFTAAKIALFCMGEGLAIKNNIKLTWARLFYVYGPGQRKESLIPYLINCKRNGITPKINNLHTKNDFVFVDDAARATELLIKKSNGGIYNIGSGRAISAKRIAEIISDHKIKSKVSQKKDRYFYADISKIKNETGWNPQTTIRQGIAKVCEYSNEQTKNK